MLSNHTVMSRIIQPGSTSKHSSLLSWKINQSKIKITRSKQNAQSIRTITELHLFTFLLRVLFFATFSILQVSETYDFQFIINMITWIEAKQMQTMTNDEVYVNEQTCGDPDTDYKVTRRKLLLYRISAARRSLCCAYCTVAKSHSKSKHTTTHLDVKSTTLIAIIIRWLSLIFLLAAIIYQRHKGWREKWEIRKKKMRQKTKTEGQRRREKGRGSEKSWDLEVCVGVGWILESWLVGEKQIGN